MAIYLLKEVSEKLRLFLPLQVSLKAFNFSRLFPESRPNYQSDRKWLITDIVFNFVPKRFIQQKVKMASIEDFF